MNKISPDRSVICLVTDRLSAGALGAYGNTWANTPCFDKLAFDSHLMDQAILAEPTLSGFYDGVWRGRQGSDATSQPQLLPEFFNANGIDTILVTDEPVVAADSTAEAFGEILLVGSDYDAPISAGIEQTALGIFFATAADCIAARDRPALLWLHTRGMGAAWDAPYEMRQWYAAEEDPLPPSGREVPSGRVSEADDPDDLLGIVQAYAAQVSLWDMCLGVLTAAIAEHNIFQRALFSAVACRGFPLGEHGCIGVGADGEESCELYGELLHVPWLYRLPGGAAATRSNCVLQPIDLYETLIRWQATLSLGDSVSTARDRRNDREFAISKNDNGGWAIRTPAWFLRASGGEASVRELYVKPDDRWEVNNVADRCAEVVTTLERIYDEVSHGQQVGPLDDILLYGIE